MNKPYQISQECFNAFREIFSRAVVNDVSGRDVSNALISSDDPSEFIARVRSHELVAKVMRTSTGERQ